MKIKKQTRSDSEILRQQRLVASGRQVLEEGSLTIDSQDQGHRALPSGLSNDSVVPFTKRLKIHPGTPADVKPLNKALQSIGEDLKVVAGTVASLEEDLVLLHNQVVSKESDIIGQIKTARSKIATIGLYNEGLVNNKYLTYSFDDSTELQAGTASFNEEEGALTLPISEIKTVKISNISLSGNGRPGNNFDRSRNSYNNIQAVIDGTTQTWFEYEKISNGRGAVLTLTLKLDLETPTVINKLIVTPANFGTTKWVEIKDIQIERNGQVESIKSEVIEPGRSSIILEPAASRFAGVGIFNFYPREATSVHIEFVQTESTPILGGQVFRTAIGIKEIEIQSVRYEPEGTFHLAQKSYISPVLAIGLKAEISLGQPSDYSATFEARVNDESAWTPLNLLVDLKVDETVSEKEIEKVEIKGKISRSATLSPISDSRIQATTIEELKSLSSGTTELGETPKSFLEIIQTGLGAVGEAAPPLYLGSASGILGVAQTFTCPIELNTLRSHIEVNGVVWNFVSSLGDETYQGVLYFPERSTSQIQFGDGINGKLPSAGAEVYLKIRAEETSLFSETEEGVNIELNYQADKIKESTTVYYRDFDEKTFVARIGPLSKDFKINPEHQSVRVVSLQVDGSLVNEENERPFQNGVIEFDGLPENDGPYYSIDRTKNKVHLSLPLATNAEDAVLEYKYQLKKKINSSQWRFSSSENKIIINPSVFPVKKNQKTIAAQTLGRTLKLVGNVWLGEDYTLVKNSITPIDINGVVGISRTLQNELPFIDGASEFSNVIIAGISLLGFYSVNYKTSTIHLPPQEEIDEVDKGFLPGIISFSYVGAEIEYGIGRKLTEGSDYTRNGKMVTLRPSYNRRNETSPGMGRFHFRYDQNGEQNVSGTNVTPYFSPVLRSLTVVGAGIDSRFAGVIS